MTSPAVRVEGISKVYRIRRPSNRSLRRRLGSVLSRDRSPDHLEIRALDDVSFEVREGEVFGIVGRNGAGKSTLLKILSRITAPSSGRARIVGRVASLLEVGTGFHPELTGRENVYLNGTLLGMPAREVDGAFEAICEFAGIGPYIDTPIKRYSSGMQLRLAFSVAAHLAADTLIVDEVLAVGDAEFQQKCTRVMRDAGGRGRTTLFVSHNMVAVENLCRHAILLERGRVVEIGSGTDVVQSYLRRGREAGASNTVFEATSGEGPAKLARITRATIDAGDGPSITQGDDLTIEVEIETRELVRRLQLVARIATMEGQPVIAVNNGDARQEWDLAPGRHVVKVELRDVRLLPRAYSLSLQLALDWGAETLDDCPDAISFSVAGRDVLGTGVPLLADRGVTWFPARFSAPQLRS